MEIQDLEFIEINPKLAAIGTVIWMHGLGASGDDFVPVVPELSLPANLPIRFIFPHAREIPVTINNGYVMRAWFDIISLRIEQSSSDRKGIIESVADIRNLIKKEVERGIPAEKIVLAGFSQGAVIALTAGLVYPKRLGGIIALSGYFPHSDQIFAEASEANRSIPIFLAHGKEDLVLPFMLGEMTRDLLEQQNYSVNWHGYNMGHTVCKEEVENIGKWLVNIFQKH